MPFSRPYSKTPSPPLAATILHEKTTSSVTQKPVQTPGQTQHPTVPQSKSPEADWLWDSCGDWTSYGEGSLSNFWATRQTQLPQIWRENASETENNICKDETSLSLKRKGRKLTAAMRHFTVNNFSDDRINTYEMELLNISNMRDELIADVEDFLEDFETDISFTEVLEWNESIKEIEKNVRDHALAINKHAIRLSNEKKLILKKKFRKDKFENIDNNYALAWAEAKYKSILNGDGDLDDEMYQDASDGEKEETVEMAMKNFKVRKEITKTLTLTAADNTEFKTHMI